MRAVLASWWTAPTTYELRAAILDTKRHPGLVVFGAVLVFWPLSGFTWFPLLVAALAWLLVWFCTRWLRWWSLRWRVRRALLPFIGLLTLFALTADAGPNAWGIAVGAWLIIAAFTDTWRARRRTGAWIREAVARTTRADPRELRVVKAEWEGRRLVWAEIDTGGRIRVEEQAVRDRIATAVSWCLRHAGGHTVTWPPGSVSFEITADPPLPESVSEQPWPPDLPGIPIGVTDTEHADGTVDVTDAETGEPVNTLPVLLVNPGDSERHYLIVGGTGAGKTNFTRGFIARALRTGWFPGGCFIFDGKGSSDYITFEGRQGVRCVAREPAEWETFMAEVAAMMRARYDEDAAYHRGLRPKPDQPRWMVVLEEVQEIRRVLGPQVVDPWLQQIARQVRAANGRLVVVTQRPDTDDAIPGAVRDMLEDRIVLGFVSGTGARMVFENDWKTVTDEYGQTPVPGRGIARIAGRMCRIQSFRLDLPREHPEVEPFYPPPTTPPTQTTQTTQTTQDSRSTANQPGTQPPASPTTARSTTARSTTTDAETTGTDTSPESLSGTLFPTATRWAPRPAPVTTEEPTGEATGEAAGHTDPDASTPPSGVPIVPEASPPHSPPRPAPIKPQRGTQRRDTV